MKTKTNLLLLAIILILAAALRLWALDFGLPARYHIDESPYVLAALEIGRGNLNIAYPLLSPNLYEVMYTMLFGLLFGVLFISGQVRSPSDFAAFYDRDPSLFYLAARSLGVLASLGAILMLFLLVRRLRDAKTGLLAALFLAVSFLDVRHAHFAEVYPILSLAALGSVYTSLAFLQSGRRRDLLAAGALSGVTIGLRLSAFPLALVPLVAIGLRWLEQRQKQAQPATTSLVVSTGLTAMTLGLGFLVSMPSAVINLNAFLQGLASQAQMATESRGFFGYRFTSLPAWRYYGELLELSWGWPLLGLALAGAVWLAVRRKREDLLVLVFPAAYSLLLLMVDASSSAFARYLVPALPFMAFCAAEALVQTHGWLARRAARLEGSLPLAAIALLLVLLPATRSIRLDWLWSQTDTRQQAKTWAESNLPKGARIANFWFGPFLSTPTQPEANSTRRFQADWITPFSYTQDKFSLDHYRQQGYDYLIVNDFVSSLEWVRPEREASKDAFFAVLDDAAVRLAEFSPYPEDSGSDISFEFEEIYGPLGGSLWSRQRPGPTVRIYDLRQR